MDGSSASLIAIPIVVTFVLAAWLILVAYAATHPQWKHGTSAMRADGQLRHAELRAADQTVADAGHDAIPVEHAKLAA